MSGRTARFLAGFLPPTAAGFVLALIGGPGTILVYCNTTTPIPPNWDPFGTYAGACAQAMPVSWVPDCPLSGWCPSASLWVSD